MSTSIRHDHELLLESLLAGKLPRNLHWADVLELIKHIGEVVHHDGNEYTFVVATHRIMFKRPHHDTLDVEEASRLRKFLKEATPAANPVKSVHPKTTIVVIDHHVAHIYQDIDRPVPEESEVVKPYDPFGFHHHLIHRKEAHYSGDRVPEENSFYEEIATDIKAAEEIVIIGHAKGKSSAMDFLVAFLEAHHPDLFKRIKTTEIADLSALTEPEIEEIAKNHLHN
jgi:hypothetical protein